MFQMRAAAARLGLRAIAMAGQFRRSKGQLPRKYRPDRSTKSYLSDQNNHYQERQRVLDAESNALLASP